MERRGTFPSDLSAGPACHCLVHCNIIFFICNQSQGLNYSHIPGWVKSMLLSWASCRKHEENTGFMIQAVCTSDRFLMYGDDTVCAGSHLHSMLLFKHPS